MTTLRFNEYQRFALDVANKFNITCNPVANNGCSCRLSGEIYLHLFGSDKLLSLLSGAHRSANACMKARRPTVHCYWQFGRIEAAWDKDLIRLVIGARKCSELTPCII